jgi:hypothetical protein
MIETDKIIERMVRSWCDGTWFSELVSKLPWNMVQFEFSKLGEPIMKYNLFDEPEKGYCTQYQINLNEAHLFVTTGKMPFVSRVITNEEAGAPDVTQQSTDAKAE